MANLRNYRLIWYNNIEALEIYEMWLKRNMQSPVKIANVLRRMCILEAKERVVECLCDQAGFRDTSGDGVGDA